MGNKYNAARPKNLVQKKAKGNKKRNNKYLPTTLHLSIFPLRKTNKKQLFFCNNSKKKIKALFFVTSLKKKKASFKNLCHSIPKRFNLNTTVPLLRILPSHLYSTPYGTEKLELFISTPISMFQMVPSIFYCTFCTFPIKTFYVSIAFSCHKIIFFFFWL